MEAIASVALGVCNLTGVLALVIRDLVRDRDKRTTPTETTIYSECFTEEDRQSARATASNVKALCKAENIQPME